MSGGCSGASLAWGAASGAYGFSPSVLLPAGSCGGARVCWAGGCGRARGCWARGFPRRPGPSALLLGDRGGHGAPLLGVTHG